MEKIVVRRFFFSFNYDVEEKWLNQMMMAGWKLCKVAFFNYEFEACVPESQKIVIETQNPDEEHLAKLEAKGVEMVAAYHSWHYYAKAADHHYFDKYREQEEASSRLLYGILKVLLLLCLILIWMVICYDSQMMANMICAVIFAFTFGGTGERKELLEDD